MSRHLTLAAFSLLIGTIVAGCTNHTTGAPTTPTRSSASGSSTSNTNASQTSRLLPPRPRDLDITGLDPCKALTVDQEKQLQYDRGWQRPPGPDTDYVTNTPNCAYGSSQRRFGSLISFVTNEDAEVWLTDSGRATGVRPEKMAISGFPALEITVPQSKRSHTNCQVLVDVHDKQYINIFSDQLTGGDVDSTKAYCQEAEKVAGMVLENAENR